MTATLVDRPPDAGVVPDGWRSSSIGQEVDLLTGFPFPSKLFADSGVRLLRGSNVKRGSLDWSDSITEHWPSSTRDVAGYELRVHDVVVAMDGALVGRSYARVSANDVPSLLVQRVARLRSKSVDQGLLASWVGSAEFVRHVDSVKTHTAIPHISPHDIRSFPITVPNDPVEQRAISTALGDVDALLDGLTRLLAKKSDLKQAAMQQLLTGQARLPGFHEDWPVRKLGDVCEKIQDGTHFSPKLGGNDFLYITSKNIGEGFFDASTAERIGAGEHAKIYRRCDVRFGDLLLTKDGANTGNAALNPLTEPFSLLSSVAFLRFDARRHVAAYFLYQILSSNGQRQIADLMSGNAITRLTLKKIRALYFPVPPFEEQSAIATVLSDMDVEIAALEARRDKTRLLKQAMMQELLTGRTRLI